MTILVGIGKDCWTSKCSNNLQRCTYLNGRQLVRGV